jgi:hypothetical protein
MKDSMKKRKGMLAGSLTYVYAPDTSGVFVSLCHHSVGVICVLYLPYSGNFERLNLRLAFFVLGPYVLSSRSGILRLSQAVIKVCDIFLSVQRRAFVATPSFIIQRPFQCPQYHGKHSSYEAR